MLYYEFEVKDKVYKLRLTTRGIVQLEKKIGCNPLAIFGTGDTMPTISSMISVFHASLQQYNHGITEDGAYEIFDEWLNEGHSMTEFIPIILEIYKVSGLIRDTADDDDEKN